MRDMLIKVAFCCVANFVASPHFAAKATFFYNLGFIFLNILHCLISTIAGPMTGGESGG